MYPFINIFGKIQLPSYGLCMLMGIALALVLSRRRCKKTGMTIDHVLVISGLSIGFAIVVGWLLYVVTKYSLFEIRKFISSGDFSFLNDMGIVFYGGLMGGVLGMLVALKLTGIKVQTVEYAIVPFVPFGHAVGRVGCFLAGCCYGMEYEGVLAVHYPGSSIGRFPSQLTESLGNVIIGIVLVTLYKKPRKKFYIFATYGAMYAVLRFFNEFTRGDAVRGAYLGVSTSQWISIGLAVLILTYFVIDKIKNK